MRKSVAIPIPTAEELEPLEPLYQSTKEVQRRTRAQIILLAGEQRITAPTIAKIVRENDQTVRQVLKTWEIVLSRPQHKISSPDPDYLVREEMKTWL